MQKMLYLKAALMLGLILLIAIPLMMIQSTIAERLGFHAEAARSIAADSVREQTLIGPIMVIPYSDEYDEIEPSLEVPPKASRLVKHQLDKRLLVFPMTMTLTGGIKTARRYRGIHQVLTYASTQALSGDFAIPAKSDLKRDRPDSKITVGLPFVALSIDDVRGIKKISPLKLQNDSFEFAQGTQLTRLKDGLHATLAATQLPTADNAHFEITLELDGMERLTIAPVAKDNLITLKSDWPHPQFGGYFLPSPATRTVNENGFSASWSISSLASGTQQQIVALEQGGGTGKDGAALPIEQFNVSFIEPINIYSQADRAVKYGLLFVALTFVAFFLFEVIKRLPVHPVQYLLVGLALALFFLLLVSLSEHLSFLTAYLLSSAGCIGLIGFYLRFVLHSWTRGFGFGCALTVLYGALYGILQSESNALVLGSALLFALLAAMMILTRKVNWYQLGTAAPVKSS